jgi:hypothetical protein
MHTSGSQSCDINWLVICTDGQNPSIICCVRIVVWPKKLAPCILSHEVGPGCHDRKMFGPCWILRGPLSPPDGTSWSWSTNGDVLECGNISNCLFSVSRVTTNWRYRSKTTLHVNNSVVSPPNSLYGNENSNDQAGSSGDGLDRDNNDTDGLVIKTVTGVRVRTIDMAL